jgi:phosphoglycolate/pyridoxal phosphate phosphatase family enzyme
MTKSSSSAVSIIEESDQEVSKAIQWLNELQDINDRTNKLPIVLQTQKDVLEYLEKHTVETFLFDCDGVLYRSPDSIAGARECILSLLDNNKSVYFITNNAASNRQQLRAKLTTILNLPNNLLTDDMMISSSYSCAQYLKQYFTNHETKPIIYVIGSQGLCDEIKSVTSFNVITTSESESYSMTREELADYIFPDEPIDAVVVGHDTSFHFRKLCIATVLLQNNPTALLVATNMDSYDLVGNDGRHLPGNGALVSAVQYATKRSIINVGKPSTTLFDLLQNQYPTIDPQRTMMIGDRLDTDIKFGTDNNMIAALVMTGVTTAATLQQIGIDGTNVDEPQPTIILSHIGLLNYNYNNNSS